jgi:O-antigen/teichoic acid export membrane protein
MSRQHKKLVQNSILFTIGNIGSKLITFVLVPLYTFYISKADFGKIDLIITVGSLILPVVSLSLYEGVLRFVIDQRNNSLSILKGALSINVIAIAVLFGGYFLLKITLGVDEHYIFMIALVSVQSIYSTLVQYTRGIGQTKLYTIMGILLTLFIVILNILFLVILKMSIVGYMLSYIISYIIIIILLLFKIDNFGKIFTEKKPDNSLMKQLIFYSLPLIPNAILWWIISASSKLFLVRFHGLDINGLFAISNKIPSILTIFTFIFTQAWQISALEESTSDTKNEFYTEIFSYYKAVLFIGSSIIIPLLVPFYAFFISSEYYESISIVPFLLIAAVFSSFAGFFGTNYLATKNTKGVLYTSIFAGIFSVVLNIFLIPKFGALGAALSTMFSYLALWMIRVIDTRKEITIKISLIEIMFLTIVLYIQSTLIKVSKYGFILSLLLIGLVVLIEWKEIKGFTKMIIQLRFKETINND